MTSSGREQPLRGSPTTDLASLAISVAIHLLALFLLPAPPQPVFDVYPLDFAGVVEIASVQGQPASPAPAPGVEISAEEPKPAVVQEKKPEPVNTPLATVTPVEPTVKPEVKPEVKPVEQPKPEPVAEPSATITPVEPVTEPQEPTPVEPTPEPTVDQASVEEQTLMTRPVGDTPIDTAPVPEGPKPVPVEVPQPTLTFGSSSSSSGTQESPVQGQAVAEVPQAGPGKPEGTGTVPRPEFPGTDPTGWSMVKTSGGSDHGVWIPKGVQNTRGKGESTVRVEVSADGKLKSATMVKAPPDSAMSAAILNAVESSWQFLPDQTEGRSDSYFIEFRIGYDGGSGDVWVDSLRAFY